MAQYLRRDPDPAAMSNVLADANADEVTASLVVEAVNLPTAETAQRRLPERRR